VESGVSRITHSGSHTDMEHDDASSEKPVEITDKAREAARKMAAAYDDRPTVVLPGSGHTVTGTAVNSLLDDDGNPKYGGGKAASVDRESVVKIESSKGLSG
jgi:hypothetical protein